MQLFLTTKRMYCYHFCSESFLFFRHICNTNDFALKKLSREKAESIMSQHEYSKYQR